MEKIYYHGTRRQETAKLILKNGFKTGTYFADHLENALAFGGNHIFGVCIDFKFKRGRRPSGFDWQVICANKIESNKIVEYKIYKKPKIIYKNKKLGNEIFNRAIKRYKKRK